LVSLSRRQRGIYMLDEIDLKPMDGDEKKELLKETQKKTSFIVRFLRMIKNIFVYNLDLVFLTVLIMCFLLLGYYIAVFRLGLSTNEIKIHINDFLTLVGTLLVGIFSIIGKICVEKGEMSKKMTNQVLKKSDRFGRTIQDGDE